jgi:hypothetical protein
MLNSLPKLFGKIPIGALAMITNLVDVIHTAGNALLERIGTVWQNSLS